MTSTASHLSTAPGLALSSGVAADGNNDQDYRTSGPSESALSADWNGPAPDTGADRSAAVPGRQKPLRSWPLLVLAAPAAVAVWSGWVGIGQMTGFGRRFARWSAIAALVLGMAGQVAYHLLAQAGVTRAPWEVTTVVSCLPVLVLGMGSALAHLLRSDASLASAQAHFISLQTSDQKLTGQYVRDGSGQEQPGLQAHINLRTARLP